MQAMIQQRFECCRLRLNEEKTKIVYCKSSRQKECYPNVTFDFLGFTFQPRESVDKYGNRFTGFLPAISRKSMKRINETMRSWHLNRHSNLTLEHLASDINPIVRGWMTYYGKFYPCLLYTSLYSFHIRYDRLFMVHFKEEFPFYEQSYRFPYTFGGTFGFAKYHRIVCVTDKGVSTSFQFLVQFIEHDIT